MKALVVIDAQNEFSSKGKRPVQEFEAAVEAIGGQVKQARKEGSLIAWVRHYNRSDESLAFQRGDWGSEFIPGFGPASNRSTELVFEKEVYGAFTGSDLGAWLRARGAEEILLVGFYTHGCLSTTAREAIMLKFRVCIDPEATSACEIRNSLLGDLSAAEVKRSALLHLADMGALILTKETRALCREDRMQSPRAKDTGARG